MSLNVCESLSLSSSLSVRVRVESNCEPEPVSAKVWIPQVPLFSPSVFVDTLPTWHWLHVVAAVSISVKDPPWHWMHSFS